VLTDTSLFRIRNASPKNKLVLGADWQAAQWSLLARATRFGPLKDFSYDDEAEVIDGVHAQRFGAVWTLDLEAQYKLSKQLTYRSAPTTCWTATRSACARPTTPLTAVPCPTTSSTRSA
jgi:outer membrane receptor for ferrienterochelin and colicin